MSKCFISGIGCVSSQESTNKEKNISSYLPLTTSTFNALKPNYKDFIPAKMIRRMATGVKMGISASSIALSDANIEVPDAIITGTGMGCLLDSEKFLTALIKNDEQYLTPTPFIQSTHNTVGAQIALGLKCKAYNVTYVHDSTSFETAVIDAMMMIDEQEANIILIGGTDEMATRTNKIQQLVGIVKKEEEILGNLIESKTSGILASEGAQFFVLEDKITENSYAELLDVEIHDFIEKDEVKNKLDAFLANNSLTSKEVDLVVLGNNGDFPHDEIYNNICKSSFEETQQLYYKHLSGEYHTVTAFGMWIACKIIKSQEIPDNFKLNQKSTGKIATVLLYNQNRGNNHSFTLLKSC